MAVSRFAPPQSLDERIPPHSIEAEMSALGAMMLSERGAEEVQALLTEDDFYRPGHREVFRAMRQLMLQAKVIDLVTLPHELEVRGKLVEQ